MLEGTSSAQSSPSVKTIENVKKCLRRYRITTTRDKIYGIILDSNQKIIGHFFKPVDFKKEVYDLNLSGVDVSYGVIFYKIVDRAYFEKLIEGLYKSNKSEMQKFLKIMRISLSLNFIELPKEIVIMSMVRL